MTDQQRPMGHSSVFAMFGDALVKGVPTAATFAHLKYTEARVGSRFEYWWYDVGLDAVRRHRAQQSGRNMDDDTNDYPEMHAAARKYALNVLAGSISRKLLRHHRDLLLKSGQEVDERISAYEQETAALYTILRDGGINADSMIHELS